MCVTFCTYSLVFAHSKHLNLSAQWHWWKKKKPNKWNCGKNICQECCLRAYTFNYLLCLHLLFSSSSGRSHVHCNYYAARLQAIVLISFRILFSAKNKKILITNWSVCANNGFYRFQLLSLFSYSFTSQIYLHSYNFNQSIYALILILFVISTRACVYAVLLSYFLHLFLCLPINKLIKAFLFRLPSTYFLLL